MTQQEKPTAALPVRIERLNRPQRILVTVVLLVLAVGLHLSALRWGWGPEGGGIATVTLWGSRWTPLPHYDPVASNIEIVNGEPRWRVDLAQVAPWPPLKDPAPPPPATGSWTLEQLRDAYVLRMRAEKDLKLMEWFAVAIKTDRDLASLARAEGIEVGTDLPTLERNIDRVRRVVQERYRQPSLSSSLRHSSLYAENYFDHRPSCAVGLWRAPGVEGDDVWWRGVLAPLGALTVLAFLLLGWRAPATISTA